MTTTLKYHLTKGSYWERLIMVKDKDSRRIIKPLDAWGSIKVGELGRKDFQVTITNEGGIVIHLTADDTIDLPTGTLEFDVIAQMNRKSLYYGNTVVAEKVAQGTITVSSIDAISPVEEKEYMELRMNQREDFYRTFTWKDDDGDLIVIQNAYMQAVNTLTGNPVIDLRWYNPPPSDGVIGTFDGHRRGYISPNLDGSIIVHVSHLNTVNSGTYAFDLFVQDAVGNWSVLTKGSFVVEQSYSVMPS